jgi:hypothetical protein
VTPVSRINLGAGLSNTSVLGVEQREPYPLGGEDQVPTRLVSSRP